MFAEIKKLLDKWEIGHATFVWLLCALGALIVAGSVLAFPEKFFAVISTLAGVAVSLVVFFAVLFGFGFFFLGTKVSIWDDVLKGNRSLALFLGMFAIALAILISRGFV